MAETKRRRSGYGLSLLTSQKPLNSFLFPAVNIILALSMLWAFITAGISVAQTFKVADMSVLRILKPEPMNYIWDLNIRKIPLDKSRLQYYVDFYEHYLHVFPCLRDAYGILGYAYHYLGDDVKSMDYLKKAIVYNPLYPWNYYNLAVIDINQSHYDQARDLLLRLLQLDTVTGLKRLFISRDVYDGLLDGGGNGAVTSAIQHFGLCYRVSADLLRLINQMPYNNQVNGIIKNMKMDLYAF